MSQAITYSKARQNLADTMNRVCDHHEAVIITRQKSPSVVMMSLEESTTASWKPPICCARQPMPLACGTL